MICDKLPPSAKLKVDLMFDGFRYSGALEAANSHAFPNFYPYRFEQGEENPTGQSKIPIPYLLTTPDGTLIRIKGNGRSPWLVQGNYNSGYQVVNTDNSLTFDTHFEPLPNWMGRNFDGLTGARAGVSLHGDMAVINVAPGCEYFLHKKNGRAIRCTFCAYGAPDERTAHLGQKAGQIHVHEDTQNRMLQVLAAALEESEIRHIYLVGGSLPDWRDEAIRFLDTARAVQSLIRNSIPVTLGSGAIPSDMQLQFYEEKLVDSVCFNLEIWSEELFSQICPGKNHFVGYDNWIASLEHAVQLWGKGRVYSAMVAGIELEPEYNMTWEQAKDLAIKGAEDLCSRGIIPIYSLYWPVGGRDHKDYMSRLRSFFESLNLAYFEIRKKYQLSIWEGFMCHRCAYMQLECDMDRGMQSIGPGK